MRIHLGHHFYGAGNLGDDFMLAGFLAAMRTLVPTATFTCCVPFPLDPLRERFPGIGWREYNESERTRCIHDCDAWLGLGGSPFQSAQSRWFIDHLAGEATVCRRERKPMFFLGIGVQTSSELNDPEVQRVCVQASGIWTRDAASAERLNALQGVGPVESAADVAHLFFRDCPPPSARAGRVTLVVNFDFGGWPGQRALLAAIDRLGAQNHVWLAQESRELPGAELALHAQLAADERKRWTLVRPELPGAPLAAVLPRWPSGEWLVSARYHAALAGAWSGSRVVVIATNEKLRGVASELNAPLLAAEATEREAGAALAAAVPQKPPVTAAERAFAACAACARSAVAQRR